MFEYGSRTNVNSCSPSPPDHSTVNVAKLPLLVGSTGCIFPNRSLAMTSPSAYNTASVSSSVSAVPAFSKDTVTVTISFGSGATGLNSMLLPSC